jgi:predicted Zn-dependent protease
VFRKLDELSSSAPNDPVVLTCLGAMALTEKKDNAKAFDYFSHALKLGSEEPTTYLNLAVALENLGRHQEAEAVLERGVAAYPCSGLLVARLAQQYFSDGQTWRASVVVHQYSKVFPEDAMVREALKQMEGTGNAAGFSTLPNRNGAVGPPK